MLRTLQIKQLRPFSREFPGESAAGKGLAPGRGPPLPSDASPALCALSLQRRCLFQPRSSSRFRGRGPRKPQPPLLSPYRRQPQFQGAKCSPTQRHQVSTVITRPHRPCYASSLPPPAAPLLGRSHSGSQQSRPRSCSLPPLPLQGTAPPSPTCPLFLHTFVSFRCARSSPCVRYAPTSLRSVLASRPQKCSGRPGSGPPLRSSLAPAPLSAPLPRALPPPSSLRSVPLAQTVSEQVRHRLCRFLPRINAVTSYLNSKVSACSRRPSSPASPSVRRSLLWAVPAQAA